MKALKPCSEQSERLAMLNYKLLEFYNVTKNYSAFQETNYIPACWEPIKQRICINIAKGNICKVLELGAGRSGFAKYLGNMRSKVCFTAQDVTAQNIEYLNQVADQVVIGDISRVSGEYDVIFSTYVFEHVCHPIAFLEKSVDALRLGGSIFIFSPRYDFPWYLSHSCDHIKGARRLAINAYVLWSRLKTILTGVSCFLVHDDPALFHLPWAMDRDAVHWVSFFDIRAYFRNSAIVRKIKISSGAGKEYFVKKYLTTAVEITPFKKSNSCFISKVIKTVFI